MEFNGGVIWTMIALFFWMMFIWMFIMIASDIFRRDDIHGWSKAGWLILICVLPAVGILIYIIARPKMTEQDKEIIAAAQEQQRRLAGYSSADEIAKLSALKEKGDITAEEFEEMKKRALAPV